jgi:tetratricopeptide (TPR) repeat protein
MNHRVFRLLAIVSASALTVLALCVGILHPLYFKKIEKELGDLQHRSDAAYTSVLTELEALSVQIKGIEQELHGEAEVQKTKLETGFSSVGRRLAGISDQVGKISAVTTARRNEVAVTDTGSPVAFVDTELDSAIRAADAAYRAGRYEEASKAYAALARTLPGEKHFTIKRALSLYKANPADRGNYAAIERDLASVLLDDINGGEFTREALETLAHISIERGDFYTAHGYFSKLVALDPSDLRILKNACESAIVSKNKKAALEYIEKAIALSAEDKEVQRLKSRVDAMDGVSGGVSE